MTKSVFKEHRKINKSKRYKASKQNQRKVANTSTFETFKSCFLAFTNSENQYIKTRKIEENSRRDERRKCKIIPLKER